jgi:hypothetical protein
MEHTLLQNLDIRSIATTLAGSTYQIVAAVDGAFVQGDAVDMSGYEAVLIGYKIGTGVNAAVVAVKLSDSLLAASGFNDVAGSLTVATDVAGSKLNRWIFINVGRPRLRYLSPNYQRTVQNSALDGMIAVRYRIAGAMPPAANTGLGGQAAAIKVLSGPADGTA